MKFEEIELQYYLIFNRIKNVFKIDKESSDINLNNNI